MKKKMLYSILFGLFFVGVLSGCSAKSNVRIDEADKQIQFTLPGQNPELGHSTDDGNTAGFLTGLWHGLVALITLFVSFFNPEIQMYEVHNTGATYNLGFLLGSIILFGSGGFFGGRRR